MHDRKHGLVFEIAMNLLEKIISWCLAAGTMVVLWLVSLDGVLGHQDKLLSADMLYIPELVQDVVVGSGSLSDWFLAPSPEIFTEIPFYFPFAIFALPVQSAVSFYAASQVIYTSALCWIFVWLFVGRRAFSSLVVSVIVCLSGIIFFTIDQAILTPFYHYATFLDGLILIIGLLFMQGLNSPRELLLPVVIVVVAVSLVVSSGFIFVAWFILPLLGFIALKGLGRPRRLQKSFILASALIFSVLLGRLLWTQLPFKVDPRAMSRTNDSALLERLRDPFELLSQVMSYVPEFVSLQFANSIRGTIFCVFLVSVILTIGFGKTLKHSFKSIEHWERFQNFSLMSIIIVIANVCLFSLHDQQPARYMIAANYLPVVYVIVLIAVIFSGSRKRLLSGSLVMALVLALLARSSFSRVLAIDISSQRPSFVDCITRAAETRGLSKGVAQYWQARPLELLSQGVLQVSPIHGATLKHYFWATTRAGFRNTYDFVVIDHSVSSADNWQNRAWYLVDREKVIELNGLPSEIVWCGTSEILFYPIGKMMVAKKLTTLPHLPVKISPQLYWAAQGEAFSEPHSEQHSFGAWLNGVGFYEVVTWVKHELSGLSGTSFKLRIDPVSRPGYVTISNLEVVVRDESGRTVKRTSAVSKEQLSVIIKQSSGLVATRGLDHAWRVDQTDPWIELKPIDIGQVIPGNVVSLRYHLKWTEMPDSEILTLFR